MDSKRSSAARVLSVAITAVALAMVMVVLAFPASVAGSRIEDPNDGWSGPSGTGQVGGDPLVEAGYRPRFPHPGSQFIQTPSPVPEGAYMLPYGQVPMGISSPSRATWTLYFDGDEVDVYVDTSSSGGGQLSSNEKDLLDRMIDDFRNYSFVRVKEFFDPSDIVSHVDWKVERIDGASGIGGYYQPGTNEFHVDRDDLSWGGVISAHEFEHYVHRQYDLYETLWVDEGCADFGAYLVYGIDSAVATHVYSFLEYRPLNTLTVSDSEFYNDYTTSQYGTSFMFQLYMAHQYGGSNYTKALVSSTNQGSIGVTRALQSLGSTDNFNIAFRKWKVATRLNDQSIGKDGNYSYPMKNYYYGPLSVPVTASHNGVPSTATRNLNRYSITAIRFSGPPATEEGVHLKLSFSAGTPDVVLYKEVPGPRDVEVVDMGGSRSVDIDMLGWGELYSSFQVIVSSSESCSFSYELDILDIVPPVTEVQISPSRPNGENGWYISSPKITLTSEPYADIKYRINGGAEEDYTGGFYLPDGVHNLSFYSIDSHQNREVPNFRDLKVDTTAPTSTIDVNPDNPPDVWLNSRPSIVLSTPDPDAVVMYRFGNAKYVAYMEPILPPEGESTLFWKAMDHAGNMEIEYQRSFKVDITAPTVEHAVYPPESNGENGFYTVRPQLTLSTPDGTAIYFTLDSSEQRLYEGPFEVKDGTHTVKFAASDQAGNVGVEVRLSFKVDTVAPIITGSFDGFDYDIDNSSVWLKTNPVLNVQSSEQGAFVNYSFNDSPPVAYSESIFVPEGQNEIAVRVRDAAGNIGQPLSYFIKVDSKEPFVKVEVSASPVEGWYRDEDTTVSLVAVGEDERSSTARIIYRWGSSEDQIYRSPLRVPEGRNRLTYWAEDLAENRMDPRTIDLNKDSLAPSVVVTTRGLTDGRLEEGSFLIIDLSGSTDEGGVAFYGMVMSGTGSPEWSIDHTFNRTFDEAGTYNVTLYVKDLAGNVGTKLLKVMVEERAQTEASGDDTGSQTPLIIGGVAVLSILIVAIIGLLIFAIGRHRTQRFPPQHHIAGPVHMPAGHGHHTSDGHAHPKHAPVHHHGQYHGAPHNHISHADHPDHNRPPPAHPGHLPPPPTPPRF